MIADISFIRRIPDVPYADISIVDNDVEFGDTLKSAVTIMLFTDARATIEEITLANLFPSFPYDLRGWWGDTYNDNPVGSKLWLNQRRKATDTVLSKQIQYVQEALRPLVDNKVAKTVNVTAYWVRRGVMEMLIQITRPDNSTEQQDYTFIWTEV